MTYFAKCENTLSATQFLVSEVIRADQDFVNNLQGYWVLCDYNTYGNVHYAPSPPAEPGTPDGGTPIRANYPGIGFILDNSYTVDGLVGVFYAPQPYPSWILNPQTFLWEAPVPYPTDGGTYQWDEATQSWVPYTGQ
jgi:hypothetical protein